MNDEKVALRKTLQAKRQGISIIENAELSARISERVLTLPEYLSARRILCYSSFQNEVETRGLLRQALSSGKEVYLPVIRGVEMDAVRLYTIEDKLEKGRFGVMQPVHAERIEPLDLDLVLVPGIGFDKGGSRLGHGAGYYDRFLRKTRCPAVGLAFEVQMAPRIPSEPHDVKMRYVITENRIYDCGNMEG